MKPSVDKQAAARYNCEGLIVMIVNIEGLRANVGVKEFSFVVPVEKFADFGELPDVYFTGNISAEGRVAFTGLLYRIDGTISCRKHFVCGRCLKECCRDESYSFEEEFSAAPDADEGIGLCNFNTGIDIFNLVHDTIIAAQPTADFCREDCRGLCPMCGKNLNDGECGCKRETIDPRLEALREVKNLPDD